MNKNILIFLIFSFSLFAQVPDDANDVKPLLPSMTIPEMNAFNVKGEKVSITAKNLKKPFVLTFYRGGWCPYCNAQLAQMRHVEKELLTLGFDVYFISPDKPELLIESLKDKDLKQDMHYTLLSDPAMQIAQDYGIAFKLDSETVEKYKKWGLDLEKTSGYNHHYLPAPSTFLVGQNGNIYFQYTNPNYKSRLDPKLLLAAAQSYIRSQSLQK